MKVFISQGMRDKTEEEIKAEREEALKKVNDTFIEDVEEIKSFFEGEPKVKTIPLFFLGKSIKLLSEADIIIFCKGYENYRGCKIEELCAKEYGIPRMYM